MPLPIILGLLALTAAKGLGIGAAVAIGIGVATVVISYVTISIINDFLRKEYTIKYANSLAAAYKEDLKNGRVRIVVGFVDGSKVEEVRVIEAENADSEVKSMPEKKWVEINDNRHK